MVFTGENGPYYRNAGEQRGRSNFNMSDVTSFRSLFGLLSNDPNIILDGTRHRQPARINRSAARRAMVRRTRTQRHIFVLSASTNSTGGETLFAPYAVDNSIAPVLSTSFGLRESEKLFGFIAESYCYCRDIPFQIQLRLIANYPFSCRLRRRFPACSDAFSTTLSIPNSYDRGCASPVSDWYAD
jgi:hypothetical protein